MRLRWTRMQRGNCKSSLKGRLQQYAYPPRRRRPLIRYWPGCWGVSMACALANQAKQASKMTSASCTPAGDRVAINGHQFGWLRP
jgi:hypothetical protein